MQSTRKSYALVLAAALLTGCGAERPATPDHAQEKAPPLAEVAVTTATASDAPIRTELPGRVVALKIAEVRPQVAGVIVRRHFDEGGDVRAGDVLYDIDAASYTARRDQAAAELALEKAALVNLRVIAERYRKLIDSKVVTQQDHDLAQANHEQGLARVASREAALRSAQIDVQRTQIRSPIAGRVGRSAITEGALVAAGQQEALARVQQLDPIVVDIAQSSRQVTQLRRQLLAGDVQQGRRAVTLVLEDGSAYPHAGELKFAEMQVDANTGMVVLRAQFPNPDRLLAPGMYVRARVEQGVHAGAVLLPQQAVRHDGGAASALVVDAQGQVARRTLDVIGMDGEHWAVRDGVRAGEHVVVEGGAKAAPGARVRTVEWQAGKGKEKPPAPDIAAAQG